MAASISSLAFLEQLSRQEKRSYVILLDCGPSVRGLAWDEAKKMVYSLIPSICQASDNGLSLTVFADTYISTGEITTEQAAKDTLDDMPGLFEGADKSNLALPLKAAINDHTPQAQLGTSILVVTAGDISDAIHVALIMSNACHRMVSHHLLSVSFLQVGSSPQGTSLLRSLPAAVRDECKWPLADAFMRTAIPGGRRLEDFLMTSAQPRTFFSPRPYQPVESEKSYSDSWRCSSTSSIGSMSTLGEDQGHVHLAFYRSLAKRQEKHYMVLLDCSEGMSLADYNVARHILSHTLASVFELDKQGISLWVTQGSNTFGTGYITSGEKLDDLFWSHPPKGSTRLSLGLRQAMDEYFKTDAKWECPMALLVVTASPPVDWADTVDLLVHCARLDSFRMLTVSFLNVGTGKDFTAQLASEVNSRMYRIFADSHQVQSDGAESDLSRQASFLRQNSQDTVNSYAEHMFGDPFLKDFHFDIRPSKQFHSFYSM